MVVVVVVVWPDMVFPYRNVYGKETPPVALETARTNMHCIEIDWTTLHCIEIDWTTLRQTRRRDSYFLRSYMANLPAVCMEKENESHLRRVL